jgi:branched-chain amino acid transport system permease protein
MNRFGPVLLAIIVALLAVLPADLRPIGIPWSGLRGSEIDVLTLWLLTAIAAMGVNLIVGYAGQETLAQAAFLGIGAYTTALMTKAGIPFVAAFFASGSISFVVGLLLGFPALRVQKHYLAFVTLAFTVFAWLVFRNEEWLTGGVSPGMQNVPRPDLFFAKTKPAINFFWLALAVTLALAAVMAWLLRSPWGRAFMALRENAIRAESLGVDVRGYKLLAFAIGSTYGGFAGSLYAAFVGAFDPGPFALGPSLLFLLMVVVGGAGTQIGPFVGAAVAVLLQNRLEILQSNYPALSHLSYLLVYALIVCLLMAFCPTGIVGLWKRIITPRRRPHADVKSPTLASVGGKGTS